MAFDPEKDAGAGAGCTVATGDTTGDSSGGALTAGRNSARRAFFPWVGSGPMISCWQRGQGPVKPAADGGTLRVIPQAGQWN
ncbi:hypothetical protein [Luteolibacter sp. Populi]|uniref:hypothetical protein n=1 Tax=Luteolibacter sp. Populi TaxID=3230487 RepID=UPI003464EEC9